MANALCVNNGMMGVFNGELMADYRYRNDNAGVSILSWRLLKNCINFKLALTHES